MIRDSAAIRGPIETRTEVCVIGGGTAGIFLATALRRRGVDVAVLELGGTTAQRPGAVHQSVQQQGIYYRGAELGRCFGLGGTSVLWGGQMIPVTPADVAARPWVDIAAWPVSYATVAKYFPEVARALGLCPESTLANSNDDAIIQARFQRLAGIGDDFTVRLSTWLPFKTRNFSQEFAETLRNDARLCVWLNAAVTSLNTSPEENHQRITSVSARNSAGQTLQIHARHFVICAGALESTRLLLEHDERTGGTITRLGSPLGRYFSDHLSATCGRFQRHSPSRFNSAVAPIFCRGLMRTPRLELSPAAQETHRLPSAFAHVTFRTDGNSGFDVVRNFLRRKQGEQHSLGISPSRLGRVVHDVTAMAYWRYLQARLWMPTQAEVLLQIDLEQIPNPESRLLLSNQRDAHGRKRLIVDWQITSRDVAAIRTVTRLASNRWKASGLTDLAALELVPEQSFESFEMFYDVYHPTGTLRMGSAPSESVVDANLRVWALQNCHVSTTAVFPSAGSANPGFTHLALTARLADHLARHIHQGVATTVSAAH